jgi:hypothetical protein
MTNLKSKVLLVASVAAACGYVSAATIASIGLDTSANVSKEAAANTAGLALRFNASVATTVSHFAGDEWRLTLSPATASWATSGVSGFSVTCSDGDIILDAIPTISGNTMTFTVGGVSASVGSTIGERCQFSSLAVVASSVASASAVTVSFGARRPSGTVFDRDETTTAAHVFSVGSQLGSITVLSALNGVVDYQGSAGKGFATDDAQSSGVAGKEDALVVKLAAGASNTAYSLTGQASLSFKIVAESGKKFSFLDANNDGTCAAGELNSTTANGNVAPGASFTINTTCTELSFVQLVDVPGTVASDKFVTIAFGSSSSTPSVGTVGSTITPMDFPEVSMSFDKLTKNLKSTTTAQDIGAWTSNGSEVVIPYMPVNTVAASKIQPVIYITNRSEVAGPATAVMRNEDGLSCSVDLGTIDKQRTVSVGTKISDAVKTCYNTSSAAEAAGHRLYIVITASLPSASTEVYSGFTVGGSSRVSVVNNTNGK